MWSCNGSASPAVLPERRVHPIVTLWAAADERSLGSYWAGVPQGGTSRQRLEGRPGQPPSRPDPASAGDMEDRSRIVDVRGREPGACLRGGEDE